MKTRKKAEIPTVVWFAPILPFINDSEGNCRYFEGVHNSGRIIRIRPILIPH
ncbi:MAG: hypothetical protein FWG65_01455 [Turicibacter sp.]|nr:hypothetical protein [Turicibacter sp.]